MSWLSVCDRPFSLPLLAVILAGWLGTGSARAESGTEPTRQQLIRLSEEIQKAGREARYQAYQTVYEYLGDRIHVTRYRIQQAFPYLRKEIVNGPEGARVVTLQDGVSLWSYFPQRGIVVKEAIKPSEHIFPVDLPDNLDLLARNYRVVIRGPVPVDDGLECQVVEFLPRRTDRPSRELWLEVTRKLPIRMYMDFPDGRPAYRTELRGIHWDPVFNEGTFEIRVPRETKVFEIQKWSSISLQEARRLLNRRVSLPLFVPDGYAPADIVLRLETPKKRLQVIYSDGLSSYSVFQEWTDAPASRVEDSAGVSQAGAASAETGAPGAGEDRGGAPVAAAPHTYRYGLITVVTRDHGGKRTVGVGDLDEKQLFEVVRSVEDAE